MWYRKDLHDIVETAVCAAGYQLYACEYITDNSMPVLRVYIESSHGVRVDDCEKASRQVAAVLDIEDPIRSAYRLEVSSPGMDRRLFNLAHYQRYIGTKVLVKLAETIDNQRTLVGVLKAADEIQLTLMLSSEQPMCVPMNKISKVNLVIDNNLKAKQLISFQGSKRKNNGK